MNPGISDSFLEKLKNEIDDNLTNEQFGVEQLAKNVGMSRSQLHRKLSETTGQSVSQFIREHRLVLGMALLKEGDLTAAEVSDKIGFGSPTYFNKCFAEFYGFPPGEAKNRTMSRPPSLVSNGEPRVEINRKRYFSVKVIAIICVLIGAVFLFYITIRKQVNIGSKGKSIAILPFVNLSEDHQNEYFSEGVIEAIRINLSKIEALRVISRTSVEKYRHTQKSAKEIASELGVSALLEGSVQRNNNSVRVDVRLVDGVSEEQVWAKTYDHDLRDVFAIQSEIAEQVANELHAQLSSKDRSTLSSNETTNPQAYDLYLKGVFEFRTYTNQGIHNAIDLLTQAIALDSTYTSAYAYLAYSHICLASVFGAEQSALEGLRAGKPFIDKALALNPRSDLAHMLMGFYYLYHDWDRGKAEAEYKLAIVADDPDALAMYSDFLNFVTRHQEALTVAQRLNALDPYYPNSRMILSYVFNNQMSEALAFSETRIKLFKTYLSLDSHGFVLLQLKKYSDAIAYFNKAIELEGIRYPRMLGWMGAAYAKSGDRNQALKIIDELKMRLAKGEQGSLAFFIGVVYAALDEKKSAVQWLGISYKSHDMEIPWLMTEPQLLNLHNDAGFLRIADQVGLWTVTLP